MMMSNNGQTVVSHYIDECSLSVAWARAFLMLASRRNQEIVPMYLSFTGFGGGEPDENKAVRAALDVCLAANEKQSVNTVANTIFPQSVWRHSKGNRQRLYDDYLEDLPSYMGMSAKNRQGLYFSRLIAFGIDPQTGVKDPSVGIGRLPGMGNQLEFMIQKCKPGVRRSMFQAAIFDPGRDQLGGSQQGFPCLQHITFVPDYHRKTLELNAFYATQQLFVRAYGNYLGLARLGIFFADQVGLTLSRVNCFVGVEKMDVAPTGGQEYDALLSAAESALSASKSPTNKKPAGC